MLKVTIEVEPSKAFLRDVVITAVEGGIGYWAVCKRYKWEGREFPEVILEPAGEPDEFAVTTLTPELVVAGLQLALQRPSFEANGKKLRILQALAEDDTSQLDCEDCDCIIQLAVLKDVVYG